MYSKEMKYDKNEFKIILLNSCIYENIPQYLLNVLAIQEKKTKITVPDYNDTSKIPKQHKN